MHVGDGVGVADTTGLRLNDGHIVVILPSFVRLEHMYGCYVGIHSTQMMAVQFAKSLLHHRILAWDERLDGREGRGEGRRGPP